PKRSLKTTCAGVGDPAVIEAVGLATAAVAVRDGGTLGEGCVPAASRSRSAVTVTAAPRITMTATAAYTLLRLIRESCARLGPTCVRSSERERIATDPRHGESDADGAVGASGRGLSTQQHTSHSQGDEEPFD